MTRRTMVQVTAALVLLISALGVGGYSGFVIGRDIQFQDSLYCTAGHTRTYVRLLEDLQSGDVPRAIGLIETNVDAGVILLTLTPDKVFDRTAEFSRETLSLVRERRQKYPWTGGSAELRERVARALANG